MHPNGWNITVDLLKILLKRIGCWMSGGGARLEKTGLEKKFLIPTVQENYWQVSNLLFSGKVLQLVVGSQLPGGN